MLELYRKMLLIRRYSRSLHAWVSHVPGLKVALYAVDTFHAIVDRPQVAILAVGRIADRVAATDGGPRMRPAVHLSLSCDHRAVDGAPAAAFLTELGDLVEEPAALL